MNVKKTARDTFNVCAWGAAIAGAGMAAAMVVHEGVGLCSEGMSKVSKEISQMIEPKRG